MSPEWLGKFLRDFVMCELGEKSHLYYLALFHWQTSQNRSDAHSLFILINGLRCTIVAGCVRSFHRVIFIVG